MSDDKPKTEKKQGFITFEGFGQIWNPETKKLLCEFKGAQRDAIPPRMGKLTTEDPDVIKRLKELGYKPVKASED